MFNKYIDWCQTFPDWIGFPVYFLGIITAVFVPLLVTTLVSPWLLLAIPVTWVILATRWVVKNRT